MMSSRDADTIDRAVELQVGQVESWRQSADSVSAREPNQILHRATRTRFQLAYNETNIDAVDCCRGLRKILRVSWTAKKTNEWILNKAEVKRELLDTVEARKLAYYGHTMRNTRELPGERDNARNNARCTQARKATHGLDGQHQDMDRTLCGRVNQNDRGRG